MFIGCWEIKETFEEMIWRKMHDKVFPTIRYAQNCWISREEKMGIEKQRIVQNQFYSPSFITKKQHPPAAKQLPSLPQLLKLSMQGLVVRGAGRIWDFHEIYPTKLGISMGIGHKSNMASRHHLSKQRLWRGNYELWGDMDDHGLLIYWFQDIKWLGRLALAPIGAFFWIERRVRPSALSELCHGMKNLMFWWATAKMGRIIPYIIIYIYIHIVENNTCLKPPTRKHQKSDLPSGIYPHPIPPSSAPLGFPGSSGGCQLNFLCCSSTFTRSEHTSGWLDWGRAGRIFWAVSAPVCEVENPPFLVKAMSWWDGFWSLATEKGPLWVFQTLCHSTHSMMVENGIPTFHGL